jgi:prepilin-type N-terminal cleavage/methylation domain-containing protein
MLNSSKHKAGVTLVELMVVITIMGILSGLGIAGLRSAMANARIKDAAYNVTAFMERAANEARRLNTTLCVVREDDQTLVTYKAVCADATGSGKASLEKVAELKLESPTKFINSNVTGAVFKDSDNNDLTNWYSNGATFKPRAGLSAAPSAGYFAVQYGGRGLYGAALKVANKNSFMPMMKFDESPSWTEL